MLFKKIGSLFTLVLLTAALMVCPAFAADMNETLYQQIQAYNHAQHDAARTDAMAMRVFTETAGQYGGPYEPDNTIRFNYDDPEGEIAALSENLTVNCNNDQEKVKAIHDWIAENIAYDYDFTESPTSQDVQPVNVLHEKVSVCAGYSRLMTALLREAGIPAKNVQGYAVKKGAWPNSVFDDKGNPVVSTNHEWVEAYIDGAWHSYDVTWDSQNTLKNGTLTEKPYQYTYYDMSVDELSESHLILTNRDNTVPDAEQYIRNKTEKGILTQEDLLAKELDGLSQDEIRQYYVGQSLQSMDTLPHWLKNILFSETNSTASATVSMTPLLVDGNTASVFMYYINGNNYVKLRDVASLLNNTRKTFEVTWDSNLRLVNLLPGQSYTAVGGEQDLSSFGNKVTAVRKTNTVCKNGSRIYLNSYLIGGNNYFQLRDLGRALDFNVFWDGYAANISTAQSYNYA